MAKSKYHYYVLVFTNEGPKYVTKVGENHTAYWDASEKPEEFGSKYAEEMVTGLLWNGFYAVLIKSLIEITSHPYRYNEFELQFKKKGGKSK